MRKVITLRKIHELQARLRVAFLAEDPHMVFSNGQPHIEWGI